MRGDRDEMDLRGREKLRVWENAKEGVREREKQMVLSVILPYLPAKPIEYWLPLSVLVHIRY